MVRGEALGEGGGARGSAAAAPPPRGGLWLKLTVAFLSVALLAVVLVAVLANRVTTAEFRHYMVRGQLTDAQELARRLESYYAANGDWDGAAAILGERRGEGRGAGRGGGGQLYLADANGRIVAGAASGGLGQQADEEALADGLALEVGGERVGTIVASYDWESAFGYIEEEYLARVNRALLWGALGAVGAALLLGTFLAWRIATPIRQLTSAAEQIAAGSSPTSRVAIRTRDEIGQLAASFDRMAGSLAQADERRRRMTADIAHELRTPLSVIQGQVEAIQDGVFPADPQHLAPIHDEVLLLNRLVEDLRTLALAEAGHLQLQKGPVDPAALVARVGASFSPLAGEKTVELEVDAAPDIPRMMLDAHRIEQVLTNLLANAFRHTPEGGRVVVRASLRSDDPGQRSEGRSEGLVVQVCDTGSGIPASDLPYVFDRFWRGDKSRSRDRGGAGLGLAIARQLVEAHDGRIWVESAPGEGTCFAFELPIVSREA